MLKLLHNKTKVPFHTMKKENAILFDHQRHSIIDRVYPAIVSHKGSNTKGILIYPEQHDNKTILDYFAGEEYSREKVIVNTRHKSVTAEAYIWTDEHSCLISEDWHRDKFEKNDMATGIKDNTVWLEKLNAV